MMKFNREKITDSILIIYDFLDELDGGRDYYPGEKIPGGNYQIDRANSALGEKAWQDTHLRAIMDEVDEIRKHVRVLENGFYILANESLRDTIRRVLAEERQKTKLPPPLDKRP